MVIQGLQKFSAWAFIGTIALLIRLCGAFPANAQEPDSTAAQIAFWISCLDTVESTNSPVIAKVADYGEAALPLLIEKLRHGEEYDQEGLAIRNPPFPKTFDHIVGAVFSRINSEKIIEPLLGIYLETKNWTLSWSIAGALRNHKELWQQRPPDRLDFDRFELCQSALSAVPIVDTLMDSDEFPMRIPDLHMFINKRDSDVIISLNELDSNYTFTLPRKNIHLLDEPQLQDWADAHGDYLYFQFRDICIYNLNSHNALVPDNLLPFLQNAEKIAVFWLDMNWRVSKNSGNRIYMSGGGLQSLWLKSNGRWKFITGLMSWIS